jgi:hypothetical protein
VLIGILLSIFLRIWTPLPRLIQIHGSNLTLAKAKAYNGISNNNERPFKGTSVADPECLSRIPDPDFYPSRIPDLGSRIPDPKTATKDRGEKIFLSNHIL